MGNCFTFRRRRNEDDDYYHQSSPKSSGHLSPADPTLAKVGINISTSNLMEVSLTSLGHSSPAYPADAGTNDTNLNISVISGPRSPSCLTSAEVTDTTNSMSGDEDHDQSSPKPSGCQSSASPTLAKVGISNSGIMEVHSKPSAHYSPVCSAEDGTPNTNLDTETMDDMRITLSSFTLHYVLGEGSFGRVSAPFLPFY